MDNAAKAFIIAGGVLIGVIILSMAVYLFNTMGRYAAETQKKLDEPQLSQFNNRFLKYSGRTDLTIQDIITVKNYALENNNQVFGYDYTESAYRASDNNDYIDVYFATTRAEAISRSLTTLIFATSNEKLLIDEMKKTNTIPNDPDEERILPNRFICEVEISNITGRVNRIYFFEKN